MVQAALDPAEPVTRTVAARLVLSRADAFTALAAERGATVSELIRELIDSELDGRAPPDPDG
jgi:hypothetical protein